MSMIKLLTKGSWSLFSKSNPRWNCSGTGLVGGFTRPEAINKVLEKLKDELKEEPPKDLTYSYMKD